MLDDYIKEVANKFIAAGFWVIPLSRKSKRPTVEWQLDKNPRITEWDFKWVNIAMITGSQNGYAVVECDNADSYKQWLAHRPRTPLRVKSPRGMHFYYRHPGVYVKSDSHDFKSPTVIKGPSSKDGSNLCSSDIFNRSH